MPSATKALRKMPSALGVRSVKVSDLKPNPHNPRLLFDREHLDTLTASIEKVGILVPLTVYRAEGSSKYTILDGQRRWICAQEAGLKSVPINQVAEPTVAQNIVTMFQIHKLRKDWELMPTALKLAVLMRELEETRDKQLAELTRLDIAVVTRCKKLLWYPKKYYNMMLFDDPNQRVKADFFIELYPIVNDRNVRAANWYNKNKFIDRMLEKYNARHSGIKSITDFRKIKQHLTAAAKIHQTERVLKKLRQFLIDDELDISYLEIASATAHKKAAKLARGAERLSGEIAKIAAEDYFGEDVLWSTLEQLLRTIQKKLREADRRLRS